MKSKIISIMLILLAAVGVYSVVVSKLYTKEKNERKRAENNFCESQKESEVYKGRNGLLVSESKTYQLRISELKDLREKDAKAIKDLNIKLKHVDSYSKIATSTKVEFRTLIKDSLVHDTVRPCVEYKTEWTHFSGCFYGKEMRASIQTKDSIITVAHPVYKGWFIFKKLKGFKQAVQSFNPDSRITFNEFVMIKK